MQISDLAERAKTASRVLATATRDRKDAALGSMADALTSAADDVLAANASDVEAARAAGTGEALIDRLCLTPGRLAEMAQGLRDLALLPDPVGETVHGWNLPNGVHVDQVRVPFGVIGMIYEARPNVTADAAGICLKSGNASLLRGSSSCLRTNQVVVRALREGLERSGLPADCVNLVEGGHEVTGELMRARGLVDLLIPRGGAGLIRAVVEGATVPVIETGTGNCHLFVDASADQAMALSIMLNAKTQRPSVCNALETLLVHRSIAAEFLPAVLDALTAAGVTVHGDEASRALDARIVPAGEHEYEAEYLSLDLACAVVDDIDAALAHIRRYSTGHSETIVTGDAANQRRFTAEVDAAVVLVNASSRFTDGGQFGFGAEIGISTQKLHARGPMGLTEMTTTKYLLSGEGQVRA
ncbi:glutamate-5-semialdehyde dehydrogenase [Propionibacterium australiense]|uniref:Gamma-glutamyl phosphate reductase n=1 Tax=Propionibacterium australiense TaxID=119981 RepID=A0A8B3FQC7_9ACTN|nr:glutamate-5-semialdehyde dehydrogenase [Propionibacterium australiense]RLP10995.1 glutamate-5-semialdehyde dehydrogenase [Propionibacterium australiense]RLP13039.1 glutamate-5-semialdehyde dehydrogenase [Propionibacterium australiense]VEH90981.1 Gamma-glutamyl phosphate reductase [Propionibacterium australiense]